MVKGQGKPTKEDDMLKALKDATQAARQAVQEGREKDADKANAKAIRRSSFDGTYYHTKARGELALQQLLARGWEVEVAGPMMVGGSAHSVGYTFLRKAASKSA
jgi:hypothetical protein